MTVLHIEKESYTTKDVSELVGIEKHNIIQWEKEFGFEIVRNSLNHRVFYDKDIEIYKAIKVGKEKGYHSDEIRKALIETGLLASQMENALQTSEPNRLTLEDLKSEMKSVVQEAIDARDQSLHIRMHSIETKLDKLLQLEEERKNKGFWGKIFGK